MLGAALALATTLLLAPSPTAATPAKACIELKTGTSGAAINASPGHGKDLEHSRSGNGKPAPNGPAWMRVMACLD